MRNNIFGLSLFTIAISCLMMVSCNKETVCEAPALSVSSAIIASADGGTYICTYSVSNLDADGYVECLADKSWISNVVDHGGQVRFTVSANSVTEVRNGGVIITYNYTGGFISKTVDVIQRAFEYPEITVNPTTIIASYGGGDYSFTYEVTNPVEGGELKCTSDANWVEDIDCSINGTVGFTVDANDGEELRNGEISIAYSYTVGGLSYTAIKTVAVVQDFYGHIGSVSELIGTYSATGYTFYDTGVAAENTWTLKIYASDVSEYDIIIDGLVPKTAGMYPTTEACVARAYLNSDGQIVIPSQLTGYVNPNTGGYIGWTPCIDFNTTNGWYLDSRWPDCTFTYDETTAQWTSDYGEFFGQFASNTLVYGTNSFAGFFDITNPGVVITKTSNSTSSLTTDAIEHNIDENLVLHKDYIVAQ